MLEPYSGFTHVLTLLTNRFIKFYNTLYVSCKNIVSNLRMCQEKDCRSNFGLNIRNICLCNDSLSILDCKKHSVKYSPITDGDLWRVSILKDLIELKESHTVSGFLQEELHFIINNVTCN